MIIAEEDVKELKTWVIKQLENISDADSDVLADYVLALIRVDTPEPELRRNVIENLTDFLKDHTTRFVDTIFLAIHTKSYLPDYVAPKAPAQSAHSPFSGGSAEPAQTLGPFNSRKRSYNDRQGERGGFDAHYGRADRQLKQMRRGGAFNGRGDLHPASNRRDYQPQGIPTQLPMPPLPGFPDLSNPQQALGSDPTAYLMAMQAMGFPIPPLPPLPLTNPNPNANMNPSMSPISQPLAKSKIDARCRDYDTKGICARGTACPFEHGNDPILVPNQQDEYDPKNSVMMDIQRTSNGMNGHGPLTPVRGSSGNSRGRGHGRGDRGNFAPRRNRAEFSLAGPNHDRSITTIVVEQIPEDKFDEQSVRDFFSEFGTIEETTMQAYKRLALVKYENYAAAKRAYESPKVIFDNRFVKVYWYKPDNAAAPLANGSVPKSSLPSMSAKTEEPAFDREKFERDALAAQKKLEEKKAFLKEAETKRQELEQQKADLEKRKEEERRKLNEKLRAKGQLVEPAAGAIENGSTLENAALGEGKTSSHTEALKAQLAALENEAISLGIDPAAVDDPGSYGGRGRGRGRGRGGSYNGWDGFAGRGQSYEHFRGGYRGRGTFRGGRGAGAYNLDNRTKKVKVSGAEFTTDRDEGLRQYLLGVGEYENIEPAEPDSLSAQIITFKDRFTAEKFMYGTKDVPSVGKLEFTWVNTPLPPVAVASPSTATFARTSGVSTNRHEALYDGDSNMEGANADGDHGPAANHGQQGQQAQAEVDYDVAEDDDRWMAT